MKRDSAAGPVAESSRITSLDLVRGVAVLGILLMNAVHFKFGRAPYLNLSAGGSESWLDWAVGIGGEIFVDQKFMGLFSLLSLAPGSCCSSSGPRPGAGGPSG